MAIEGLHTLEVACEMIPMPSIGALYQFLNKHKDEFPYRGRVTGGPKIHRYGYEQRFLSDSEILKIREMTFFGWEDSRYNNPNAKRGRKPKVEGPLGWIVKKAMAS